MYSTSLKKGAIYVYILKFKKKKKKKKFKLIKYLINNNQILFFLILNY